MGQTLNLAFEKFDLVLVNLDLIRMRQILHLAFEKFDLVPVNLDFIRVRQILHLTLENSIKDRLLVFKDLT